MKKKLLSVLLLLFCQTAMSQYSPNLPLNSNIERLLYRLSARYDLEKPAGIYFQTMNYRAVADYLMAIDSSDTILLTPYEKYLTSKTLNFIGPHKGLFKWSSSTKDINLKVQLELSGDINLGFKKSPSATLKGVMSPSFYGNVGKLSFYSGIDVWTEYGSDTLFHQSSYQPYDGLPYNLYGRGTSGSHFRSSDKPRGGIRYDFGRIQLETAIDYLKTGPAVYYPVTLSGTTPPLTFFRGTLDMNVMNYTHVVGLLKEMKDKSKYIYVHRLGSKLWKSRIDFGLNEVIVTGDLAEKPYGPLDRLQRTVPAQRNWEWAYFIPFLPFKFVEQFSGDRDNAIITFDINLNYPKKFRWYLEFLIDDILDPQYFFTDDWGNKWALTAGVQHFGTFLNRDITVDFEYSRVEPWVYTHFYGGSHQYTHFGQSLGSVLGPNSQAFVINSTYNLHRLHTIGIGLTSIAKNDSTRGSNITDIFQFPDPNDSTGFSDIPKKRFLGPGTKWSLKPSITWCFNPFGLFSLNAKYEIDLLENRGRSNLSLWGGFSF